MKIDIDKKLSDDITAYCKINNLNKTDFINKLLKSAFTIEKYGEKPPFIGKPTIKKTEPQPMIVKDGAKTEPIAKEQVTLHKIDDNEEKKQGKNSMFVTEEGQDKIENKRKRKLL